MLQSSATEFFANNQSIERFRAQRDKHGVVHSDAQLWQQMVELGWPAMLVPEQLDGLEFGLVGMGVIAIEAGRTLAASHLLSSATYAVSALLSCPASEARDEMLRGIADGSQIVCFAQCKGALTSSQRDGFSGELELVAEGMTADSLIVLNQDDESQSLLMFDLNSSQLKRNLIKLIDYRDYATIELDNAQPLNSFKYMPGKVTLDDLGALMTACELFGISIEAFERTITYLCEREQFGQKIGAFQALQHRMAKAYMQLQMAKSVLLDALSALEAERDDADVAICHAKVICNDLAQLICTEAIQLHGGMGITDELDIGLLYKRARVLRTRFGSSALHKQRFADLSGF